MTTTTPPPVDPVPVPDPDRSPGPVSPSLASPGAPPPVAPAPSEPPGEVVLPAETVPVTIVHARQSIVAALDPDRADELDAKRLEDQRRRAERSRHLVLYPDGHGSWIIKGTLPDPVGEQVATVLNALTDQRCTTAREAAKTGAGDVVDGLADPHQVRADVLADIITAYTATGAAPTHGGDRPRITLTIHWADLLAAVGHASTEHGGTLDAGTVRRMACDADLLPAILNSNGIPLDIGRARRTIPAGLRAGVWLRDGGCSFPGCDRPPRECDCHHIIPWLIGGITALPNLVLLCPHHHARVEPATNPQTGQVIENPYRWEVRLNSAGLPEFLPPRTHDYQRTPRMHTRYTIAAYNR